MVKERCDRERPSVLGLLYRSTCLKCVFNRGVFCWEASFVSGSLVEDGKPTHYVTPLVWVQEVTPPSAFVVSLLELLHHHFQTHTALHHIKNDFERYWLHSLHMALSPNLGVKKKDVRVQA